MQISSTQPSLTIGIAAGELIKSNPTVENCERQEEKAR